MSIMSEFDPLSTTGTSEAPVMQGQEFPKSGNEDFAMKSADEGSGVAKRDSPNLDDFEKVYADQIDQHVLDEQQIFPENATQSRSVPLNSDSFSGQTQSSDYISNDNNLVDTHEGAIYAEDAGGRLVNAEYAEKNSDDFHGKRQTDGLIENVPFSSGGLSPPRATSPSKSVSPTPIVEISFPKDNVSDLSPPRSRSISPPRDLSPSRGLSAARDHSPNGSISPDRESSSSRGLSPNRSLSPDRDSSPIREQSPARESSPIRDFSPVRDPSPIREPSPVVRDPSPVREYSPVREPSPVYKDPSPIRDTSPARSVSPPRFDQSPLIDISTSKPQDRLSRDSSPSSRGSSPSREMSQSREPLMQQSVAKEETNYQRECSYAEVENEYEEVVPAKEEPIPNLVQFAPLQQSKVSSSVKRSFKVFSPMVNLIYWRDVKKSGVVFGSLMVILLSLSWLSFISVLAYTSLALLTGTISFRLYKNIMQAVQKSQDGHPFKEFLEMDTTVAPEKAHEATDVVIAQLNKTVTELKRLFLVEDLIDSVKFGCFLWMLTYLGSWFNGLTLIILSVVALFSLPKVYEQNQSQVDQYIGLVQTQFNDIVGKVKAAIPIGNKEKAQ